MIILICIVKEWLKAIGCRLGLLSRKLLQVVFFHGVDKHLVGRHLFFLSFNEVVVFAMGSSHGSSTRMFDYTRGGGDDGMRRFYHVLLYYSDMLSAIQLIKDDISVITIVLC